MGVVQSTTREGGTNIVSVIAWHAQAIAAGTIGPSGARYICKARAVCGMHSAAGWRAACFYIEAGRIHGEG